MNKELFYQKIEACQSAGYIREIYSSDYVAIFNLGEVCYVVCPYYLFNDEKPFGLLVHANELMDFINYDGLIYHVTKELIDKRKLKGKAVALSEKYLPVLERDIKRMRAGGINHVDHELEERIMNGKTKGLGK